METIGVPCLANPFCELTRPKGGLLARDGGRQAKPSAGILFIQKFRSLLIKTTGSEIIRIFFNLNCLYYMAVTKA